MVGDGSEPPKYRRDPELYYESTSFPGARLPHGWVARNGARVSTWRHYAGAATTLLTGLGGEAWVEAASRVGAQYGVPIRCQIIGPGCAIEDPHGELRPNSRGRRERCFANRPDVYVSWQAELVSADATDRLRAAMATIPRNTTKSGRQTVGQNGRCDRHMMQLGCRNGDTVGDIGCTFK